MMHSTSVLVDEASFPGPTEWYVSGEAVVDRYLEVRKCERLTVHSVTRTPTPREVRSVLRVSRAIGIDIIDGPLSSVANVDDIVLLPSGELYDVTAPGPIHATACPRAVHLKTFDLSTLDILRLNRLHQGYPELSFPAELIVRLDAEVKHLESIRWTFPDLESLILASAPIAPWRTLR